MAAAYTPRDSIPALWRQYRGYGQYRARTALRHPESLRRSAVLPPLLVLCGVAAAIAPAPLRRLARVGVAFYGLALAGVAVQTARGRRGPAALVPLALATMHVANGVGFLEGSRRWGVPWRALARVARGGASDSGSPYAGLVQAPSLQPPAADAPIADFDAWRRRAAGA
jgi:hypothetical protein